MNIIIEDNIDFYKQIYDNETSDDDTNDNICLITKLPLDKNKIVLPCNHSFNFMPLYKEVYNQKIKTSISHLETTKLRYNQIKCPYCRHTFDFLLPHVRINEQMTFCNGINSPAPLCMPFHTCKYIFSTGKNKNTQCSKDGYFEGDHCYCVMHHKTMSKKHISSKSIIGSKTNANTNTTSNDYIQSCSVILKTGKRIGQPCGAKVIDSSTNCCKRHNNANSSESVVLSSNL